MGSNKPAKRPRLENDASTFATVHQPHKPSARAKAGRGRLYTLSVALPGSILQNAQTEELRSLLISQIARTCAIFNVTEIVVFHEEPTADDGCARGKKGSFRQPSEDVDALMVRLLEYLETPQYLRKKLFAMHPSLRHVGLLPPLDLPSHVRRTDDIAYREGVVDEIIDVEASSPDKKGKRRAVVDVGLDAPVTIKAAQAEVGARVTVRMPKGDKESRLASSADPLAKLGLYWGYKVRSAASLSKVFTESPFKADQNDENLGGYDLTVGTSERGSPIEDVESAVTSPIRHALIVLGGLSGLELTIAADTDLGLAAEDAAILFDHWINACPNQGSRTIRTEEALTITLSRLKSLFDQRGLMQDD